MRATELMKVNGSRSLMQPGGLAFAGLCAATILLWWSAGALRDAKALAVRNNQIVARAAYAAEELRTWMPPVVTAEGARTSTQRVMDFIDATIRDATVGDRALRSQSIHSLGSVGQTSVSRQQERVELGGLSLTQAGMIVDALERADLPLWIESTDLTPAGPQGWSLVLEIDWLEQTVK